MSGLALALIMQVAVAGEPGSYPQFTYSEAYQAMRETGQPMLILVGAKWCPACRKMNGSIMPTVGQRGNLRYVAYTHIDVDQQKALANKLQQGTKIPQLIMFYQTPEGWKRAQLTGGHSVVTVEKLIHAGIQSTLVVKKRQEQEQRAKEQRESEPEVATKE